MKKWVLGSLLLACALQTSFADNAPKPILDRVSFQVAKKAWVTTQSALLTVDIDATLTSADLSKIRTQIMGQLEKIAKGDWHLLQFQRSQDNSGLEKLTARAQVRVNQAELTNVYQQAKSESKPGMRYQVGAIEFKPSLSETEAVREKLRQQLYQSVHSEIARLNKVYDNQQYRLYRLVFVEGEQPQNLQSKQPRGNAMMLMASSAPSAPVAVSDSLTMNALVEVASIRKEPAA